MNYLAHALTVLDCPYRLAGTALPDWLRVAAPGVRLRPRRLALLMTEALTDPWLRLAQGVLQHHRDDAEFHYRPAFVALCQQARHCVQESLPDQSPHLLAFLAHMLVELLLDAAILHQCPELGRRYYAQLGRIVPGEVQRFVEAVTGRSAAGLPAWIHRFCRLRFLFDYLDDGKLWFRCGQVIQRLGCPWRARLPQGLGALRREVYRHRAELLPDAAFNPRENSS